MVLTPSPHSLAIYSVSLIICALLDFAGLFPSTLLAHPWFSMRMPFCLCTCWTCCLCALLLFLCLKKSYFSFKVPPKCYLLGEAFPSVSAEFIPLLSPGALYTPLQQLCCIVMVLCSLNPQGRGLYFTFLYISVPGASPCFINIYEVELRLKPLPDVSPSRI